MTFMRNHFLAMPNAVVPSCDGEGEGGGGGDRPGGRGRRLGGAERRRGACAAPHPTFTPPLTPTPPKASLSSALCAIAHLVLEASVGPRLEQQLDAGNDAAFSRPVQRRPLHLPRRGGGPTHAGERRGREWGEGA